MALRNWFERLRNKVRIPRWMTRNSEAGLEAQNYLREWDTMQGPREGKGAGNAAWGGAPVLSSWGPSQATGQPGCIGLELQRGPGRHLQGHRLYRHHLQS